MVAINRGLPGNDRVPRPTGSTPCSVAGADSDRPACRFNHRHGDIGQRHPSRLRADDHLQRRRLCFCNPMHRRGSGDVERELRSSGVPESGVGWALDRAIGPAHRIELVSQWGELPIQLALSGGRGKPQSSQRGCRTPRSEYGGDSKRGRAPFHLGYLLVRGGVCVEWSVPGRGTQLQRVWCRSSAQSGYRNRLERPHGADHSGDGWRRTGRSGLPFGESVRGRRGERGKVGRDCGGAESSHRSGTAWEERPECHPQGRPV